MRLLVIDDNQALIKSLTESLGADFVIDAAVTAKDGLRQAASLTHDVIVLDIGLPDCKGSELCREIRAANAAIPIIILTAVSSIQSKVDLFTIGADDYLIKPFSLAELRARLLALMRRVPVERGHTVLCSDDLIVDVSKRRVCRASQEIQLRRKEFDILEYLLRNKGQAVTRTMIYSHVWESDKNHWHNTVDVHIKHLRDKIDRPFSRRLIQTAYGVGYLIEDIL